MAAVFVSVMVRKNVRIAGFRVKRPECATRDESGQVKDCYGFLQAPENAPGPATHRQSRMRGGLLDRAPGPALYGPVPKREDKREKARK